MAGDHDKPESSTGSQRKMISPYDITSLDNPGLSITQVQLKGDNYDEWSRSFRTALRPRKKFGFVDGTIKQREETDKDAEDWWTINSLLVSWIRNTIEPSLRSTISHVEIAKTLWDDLKDRFSIANGPRIQQLKSDLASCRQKGLTICKCDLEKKLAKKQEDEKVHTFLMGLDENVYRTTRSNILAQDPLPNMNKGGIYDKGTSTGRGRGRGNRGSTRANIVQAGAIGANNGTSDTNVIPLPGTSHHMIGMIEERSNLMEIVQCLVELPDGNIAMTKKKGDDLTSRTVIGEGERMDGGLFYFQ
ncbi:retrovirus-related pol polyprotein from transposon TNT 1-94 [Tanacetum coccineum]